MADAAPQYDVAIVGYGPVGQALAILLGTRGRRVVVLEKQAQAYPLPRAVHFDHETARILQACGLADDLRGHTESADVYEWRNATGETLLRFASEAAGLSGWPDGNMFAQPDLERLLDGRARALATVELRRGVEVTALRAADAGVMLGFATTGGGEGTVTARWVVGCDGANSFVRGVMGATVTDLGFFFDWLIVDVVPNVPKSWCPLNIQVCDPARPTTLVSGGPGRRRWEFMRLPHESLDDLDREEAAWRLLARWDVTPANARLERNVVYRFQARWVDGWRNGRVLLAGDAAHQMPPFAGQGMCSGLRDAANLAWKLELVLAGRSPATLLDTYPRERIPHVRGIIDFSMALGKVICIADPEEAAARDAVMTAAIASGQQATPPPPLGLGEGVLRAGDPHAGKLFVQGPIRTADGQEGLFDDVVGGGFALVATGSDPLAGVPPELRAWFASIGGVAAHVGDGGLADVGGAYARWFREAGVGLALQRPDFYLYGTGSDGTDAPALLAGLRAALSNP